MINNYIPTLLLAINNELNSYFNRQLSLVIKSLSILNVNWIL